MKKIFLISLTALALTGCYKDAQTTSTEGNGFEVEFLFEKDGIRVYRFNDGGHVHYFTSKGETMTSQSSGKNHYEENIN
jgi:hypothetical protein